MSTYFNTPDNITRLAANEVFVFGSNTRGRHGKGAALAAKRWGAYEGCGEGLMGQTYAIPTRELTAGGIKTRPLATIRLAIGRFLKVADGRRDLNFLVTEIGCGLAGYKPKQIAELFFSFRVPPNVALPKSFWAERNRAEPWDRQPRRVIVPEDEIGENSHGNPED